MADIFAEMDELMRRERLMNFWKENGAYIITVMVAAVLLTGALSAYRAWNENVNARQTAELTELMNSPDFPANVMDGDLDMRGGIKGIALLSAAGAFLEGGQTDEALTAYEKAAADTSIPDDLNQLAILMRARIKAGEENADSAALIKTLEPVWKDGKSPWRHHAHIQAALLLARDGNLTQAREHLSAVLTSESILPPQLVAQVKALDHVYAGGTAQDDATGKNDGDAS